MTRTNPIAALSVLLLALAACAHSRGHAPEPLTLSVVTPVPVAVARGGSAPVVVSAGAPGVELVLWFPGGRATSVIVTTDATGRATAWLTPIALGPQLVGLAVWFDPEHRAAQPVYFELDAS